MDDSDAFQATVISLADQQLASYDQLTSAIVNVARSCADEHPTTDAAQMWMVICRYLHDDVLAEVPPERLTVVLISLVGAAVTRLAAPPDQIGHDDQF